MHSLVELDMNSARGLEGVKTSVLEVSAKESVCVGLRTREVFS